ncbi:putative KAP-like P-loop domain-containing protein [Tenacibaculum sp. 190524A05c]|uniref:P-loop NTPase fold protein n=1 Tax=Tenacibaculum platacis TaxID=3137852 RepID=UPI0031FB745E
MKKIWVNTEPYDRFEEHLDSSKNVFFSGVFGIGKTSYLIDFFKAKKKKYNCFHLYPVNYSISSNQDIFELLKYDLLFELIKRKEVDGIYEINDSKNLKNYLDENWFEIIKRFAQHIPKIGKPLVGFADALKLTAEEIQNLYEKDFNNEIDFFIKGLETKSGFLYENDLITQYINSQLEAIKINTETEAENPTKTNVLLIDDLDRVDPEHIFRLLNIFSASFDDNTYEQNRFKFDKIVIVADYESLRSIYQHKFGEKSNFKGYINKFYANEVFYLKFEDAIYPILNQKNDFENSPFNNLFIHLLALLFKSHELDFRQLKKLNSDSDFKLNLLFSIDDVISELERFYDSYDNLLMVLKRIKLERNYTPYILLLECIIIDYKGFEEIQFLKANREYDYPLKNKRVVRYKKEGSHVRVSSNLKQVPITIKDIWNEFISLIQERNNAD